MNQNRNPLRSLLFSLFTLPAAAGLALGAIGCSGAPGDGFSPEDTAETPAAIAPPDADASTDGSAPAVASSASPAAPQPWSALKPGPSGAAEHHLEMPDRAPGE